MSNENQVSETLAALLHRVRAWWSDPYVPARPVAALRWASKDFSAFADRLTLAGDDLQIVLTIRDGRKSSLSRRGAFDEYFNQPLDGATSDGWRFSARAARAASWSFQTEREDYTSTVKVRGSDWRLLSPNQSPVFWAASVAWDPPDYVGNLQLDVRDGGFSRGHYYFRGPDCDYALLKGDRDRWVLVVQQRETELAHAMLRRDLNAIAFAFGAPMAVARLFAIDPDLQVIGVLGGGPIQRGRRGMPGQSPVPSLNDFGALPVLFFEHLAGHVKRVGTEAAAELTLATWYFLESLEEHSGEAVILKMSLAIVAAARYLLKGDIQLVTDAAAFADWVKAHEAELKSLERSDAGGSLRRRVANAAEGDPLAVVLIAMQKAQIQVLPELAEALDMGMKTLEGKPSADSRLFELLPRLRAIAAALIATAIDYRGRIAGWEKADPYIFYEATPQGWWTCDEEAAAVYYHATIAEHVPSIGHLWPEVPLPSIPATGPIALLSAHAASLSASTQGRVIAEIRPLPSSSDTSSRRYEFVLRAARRPTAKVVLFLLVAEESAVAVDGWTEPASLSSSADVVRFLQKVAVADETRAAIERLLIASFEAEQDAEG